MCRIASLFLLQRLKGSISGDARDFNNMETINAEYYSSLLVQLKDILKEKRRGKVTKGVLFLQDNAPAHRALATQKKLAYLGFQCLDHPPSSPDMALSHYHLFPGLKEQLKGRHFSSDAKVIAATETW